MVSYIQSLKKRQASLKSEILKLEKQTAMPQPITDEFLNKYHLLNEKRVDLLTVKSRIANYGKEVYVQNIQILPGAKD